MTTDDGWPDYSEAIAYLGWQYDELGGVPIHYLLETALMLSARCHLEAAERGGRMRAYPDEHVAIPLWLLEALGRHLVNPKRDGAPKHLDTHHERWMAVLRQRSEGGTVDNACYRAARDLNVSADTVWRSYRIVEALRKRQFRK